MTFEARYPGRCNACDEPIKVGQECTFEDDLIVHIDCETHVIATAEPCSLCFMVPAVNGDCGCT